MVINFQGLDKYDCKHADSRTNILDNKQMDAQAGM